jgi:outer membrane protein assembly factor BamA
MGFFARARRHRAVAGLVAALSFCACRSWPTEPVVSAVEVRGTAPVDIEPLEDKLATSETSLLFGVFPRLLEYSTYDRAVLAKDLARIERFLRARGYYEAKVRATRVVHTDEHHVTVEIDVALGVPVLVTRIDPSGLALLPIEVVGAAVSSIRMREGELFDEDRFESDKQALFRALADGGFAFAKVNARADVDVAAHAVVVSYAAELGPRARFGPIRISGLGEIPERPVRATLDIQEGSPYSASELEDAKKALLNLGVFTSVDIVEDRSHPESAAVPLSVTVRPSKLRTVRLGGGARFDVLRLSSHLRAGWEDRNFLGGLRHFSIEARPAITFFPTRVPTGQAPLWAPFRVLPEFHLLSSLRQPSLIEARTAGFVSVEYNLFPVLYPIPADEDPKNEPVLGYHEFTTAVGIERALLSHHLTLTPSYNWQAYFPFSYRGDAASGLEQVRVSYPELVSVLDYRDDPIEPKRGFYLSNSLQVAGYVFQGTVSDVRLRPEVRVYTRGALGRRSVFAARLGFGFLFPGDYGATLNQTTSSGVAAETNPKDPDVMRDQQKLLLRAFYSGGPSSNRGYPLREVGPHGPIGFQIPSGLNAVNCSTVTADLSTLPSGCVRPLGGLTLWELSLETRFPISGAFQGALFVDSSDVTREVTHIRLNVPHISPGFGLRYMTPVGPFRVDVGFRPLYLQQLGQRHLDADEGRLEDGFFGIPMTIDFAIGEAF